MTPSKQLFHHKPEQGVYGDCFRTAIACLLDLAPVNVPHFMDGLNDQPAPDAMAAAKAWLAEHHGLAFIQVVFEATHGLQSVLDAVGNFNPGLHYLLTGKSKTGCNHVVICRDNEIVWDPSLTDAGIIGPADDGYFWIKFLGKKL